MCDDRLGRNQVALGTAGDDEDVILRVDAVSGHLACHPGLGRAGPAGAISVSRSSWIGLDVAGEWLRPERIDLESRSVLAAVCDRLLAWAPQAHRDDQRGYEAS